MAASSSKTTWVTGAGGFVGSHLVRSLAEGGEEVLAVDRLIPEGGLPAVIAECDLLDVDALGRLFEEHPPGHVYHLAARSSAALSFKDPETTLRVNLMGTLSLLELCRERAPEARVLFVGTSEEYGPHPQEAMPLTEETPLNPISPYAVSKASATLLCRQVHRASGLAIVVARSFSHTGPGQVPVFALPSWAHQIAMIEQGESDPVIEVGNLEPKRDYMSVHDVVRAYRLLMERGRAGEIYNVCSGEGRTMKAWLDDLLAASRAEITVEVDPNRLRPVDVPFMWGDPSKIERDTGWRVQRRREEWIPELLESWRGIVRREAQG